MDWNGAAKRHLGQEIMSSAPALVGGLHASLEAFQGVVQNDCVEVVQPPHSFDVLV